MKPKKIDSITARNIIENRNPLGTFYFKENDVFIGIDNSTGDSFVEEFKDKGTCLAWLTDKSITYFTEEDFGKTLDELKSYPTINTNVHEVVITEHLVKSLIIYADTKEEAILKAKKMYDNENVILDYEDFSDVHFK